MSFESIRIYRDLPVIDSFVQVPPNQEGDKTRVRADSLDTTVFSYVRLSGSGRQRGGKYGGQELVRLPARALDGTYDNGDSDPVSQYLSE